MSDEVGESDDAESVLTIGHSNRHRQLLEELLTSHDVTRLIDVRRYPNSRRNPQFNEGSLKKSLPDIGITYEHWPEIGGYRDATEGGPDTALDEGLQGVADNLNKSISQNTLYCLEKTIRSTSGNPALMCAEKDAENCHRRLISDYLTARGREVLHLISLDEIKSHELSPHARFHGECIEYPSLV